VGDQFGRLPGVGAGTGELLPGDAPAPIPDQSGGGTPGGLGAPSGDLSKIERAGQIGLVVSDGDFGMANDRVAAIANANGGFVFSSSIRGDRQGTMVLRIPARRLDAVMSSLRKMATRVESESTTGNDVTAQFVDLRARERILKVRRTVMLRLQENATNLADTLRLQDQLDAVQLKIEQIQGQVAFINNQVAQATLRVSLREQDVAGTVEPDVGKPSLGHSLHLAVRGFLNIIGFVIVGLGYLLPIGALVGLVWGAWLLVRRYISRRPSSA
jgi:hypothetical protein